MRKQDVRRLLFTLIIVTPIWLVLAYLAIQNQRYLLSLIPLILLVITFRNQLAYYRKTEPELIDADINAAKGLGKYIFIFSTVIIILMTVLAYLGIPYEKLVWAAWLPAIILVPFVIFRSRKLRREAREKINKEKEHEADQ